MSRKLFTTAMLAGVCLFAGAGMGASLVFDEHGKIEEVTPKNLRQAAYLGDLEAVKELIAKGEDVNAANKQGLTPLHYAALEGELDVAKLLIDSKAYIGAEDVNGRTPLVIVLRQADMAMARMMIEADADRIKDRFGFETPLFLAAENGMDEIATLLMDRGAAPDEAWKGWTPTMAAVRYDNESTVRLLLGKGVNVNAVASGGGTPLCVACANNNTKMVRFLLDVGANPNIIGGDLAKPIGYAKGNKNREMVRMLLAKGAYEGTGPDPAVPRYMDASKFSIDNVIFGRLTPNLTREESLKREAEEQRFGAAKRTAAEIPAYAARAFEEHLAAGGKVDEADPNGNTSLHFAAEWGLSAMGRAALTHGAEVNARNKRGETPLVQCCKEIKSSSVPYNHQGIFAAGKTELAKALLEAGADVRAADENGFTALHMAAMANDQGMVAMLLANGADVNAQTLQHYTPLCLALSEIHIRDSEVGYDGEFVMTTEKRAIGLIELLIKSGADVNLAGSGEGTPLHEAATHGYVEAVRLLLRHGANPSARTVDGESVVDAAIDIDIVRELVDKKANKVTDANVFNDVLIYAAERDDVGLIKAVIENGASANYAEPDGWTAMHAAARWGRTKAAVFLLANGANGAARTRKGETPADVARRCGKAQILKLFAAAPGGAGVKTLSADEARAIQRKRDRDFLLDGEDGWGMQYANVKNPLTRAVISGDLEEIGRLAGIGTYLNAQEAMKNPDRDSDDPNYLPTSVLGFAPLHMAVFMDRDDALKLLLDRGANTGVRDAEGRTPLCLCADMIRRRECADVLLEHGADMETPDRYGRTVLDAALLHKDVQLAQMLVKGGLRFDANGQAEKATLLRAVVGGDVYSVQLLLDLGSGVMTTGENGRTLLHLATTAHGVDTATVKLLISRGADINASDDEGHTALFDAVSFRKWPRVDVLLAAGADKTILPKDQLSPLFAVLSTDDIPSVKRVLDMGYDINQVNRNVGETPIFGAVHGRSSNAEVIRLAIEHGASVESPRRGRESLLMAICADPNVQLVTMVMERTKDINYATPTGYTALGAAVDRGADIEIVRALLEKGANPNVISRFPKGTALDIAMEKNLTEIAELLRQYGGKTAEEMGK